MDNLYESIQQKIFVSGIDPRDDSVKLQIERYTGGLGLDEKILKKIQNDLKIYNNFVTKYQEKKEIKLRYYQILALYFTEWYFDHISEDEYKEYSKNQLAYWMATGSGKTIVMHLNILQYIRRLRSFDQLDLIVTTPLVNLINQHVREINPWVDFLNQRYKNKIQLKIETTATLLNKDKKYVNYFTLPENSRIQRLVLVDEAHIGLSSGGEKEFKHLRERLNQRNSFLYEYSATFSNLSIELEEEYKKSIIYNYDYRHFFEDGYGKDFYLKEIGTEVFANEDEEINKNLDENFSKIDEKLNIWKSGDYRLSPDLFGYSKTLFPDKPLIAFMGRTVEDPKDESGEGYETADIKKIINYLASLTDEKRRLYKNVFNNAVAGQLTLSQNKDVVDEILISYGDGEYFGIINVGNGDGFLSRIDNPLVQKRKISLLDKKYLFQNIDNKESPINVLIGSRKFAEGWNCFRVSVIGLINLGTAKGNKIVQIFGRGVRLNGFNNDGKRLNKNHYSNYEQSEDSILKLETLVILSLKKSYLQTFTDDVLSELEIPITYGPYLVTPSIIKLSDSEVDFETYKQKLPIAKLSGKKIEYKQIIFKPNLVIDFCYIDSNDLVKKTLKLSFKINLDWRIDKNNDGDNVKEKILSLISEYPYLINQNTLDKILADLTEYNQIDCVSVHEDGVVSKIDFMNFIEHIDQIHVNKNQIDIDKEHINKICQVILEESIKILMNRINYNINSSNYIYDKELRQSTDELKGDFIDKYYVTKVYKKGGMTETQLKEHIARSEEVIEEKINGLKLENLFYHIYEPVLREDCIFDDPLRISPAGLNPGEEKFIKDVNEYISKLKTTRPELEFYLMRNVESLKSIGIYLDNDSQIFYPDFIFWVINNENNTVYINYVDPKGGMGIVNFDLFSSEVRNSIRDGGPAAYYKNNRDFVIDTINDKAKIGAKLPDSPLIKIEDDLKKQNPEKNFVINSFILLRDSSPQGQNENDKKSIEKMIQYNVFRLDWHETNEKGQTINTMLIDGKNYLDLMFEKMEFKISVKIQP
jgi:hypothetical protein